MLENFQPPQTGCAGVGMIGVRVITPPCRHAQARQRRIAAWEPPPARGAPVRRGACSRPLRFPADRPRNSHDRRIGPARREPWKGQPLCGAPVVLQGCLAQPAAMLSINSVRQEQQPQPHAALHQLPARSRNSAAAILRPGRSWSVHLKSRQRPAETRARPLRHHRHEWGCPGGP